MLRVFADQKHGANRKCKLNLIICDLLGQERKDSTEQGSANVCCEEPIVNGLLYLFGFFVVF